MPPTLRKRSAPAISTNDLPARSSKKKRTDIIRHVTPPKPAEPITWMRRKPVHPPPSPTPKIPLQFYFRRGIVPLHPSDPDTPFSLSHLMHLATLRRHAANKSHIAALRSLIKAGRKNAHSTPGITFDSPKEQLVVRYEYWPVFDEFADEGWGKLSGKREREAEKEGKELTDSVYGALTAWFCMLSMKDGWSGFADLV
jgi:hypothetical protein